MITDKHEFEAMELVDDFMHINKFVNPNWRKENAKNCAVFCIKKRLDLAICYKDDYLVSHLLEVINCINKIK